MLQSGNWRKIHFMVLTLPNGLLFLGQLHNTCKVINCTARLIQQTNFCHDNCKNLAKMSKCIRVLWDYIKKWWHLGEIIVLHFVLWLSFKLSVWHREPHFLNSLPYLFIVMYAVLFHDQKLFPFGIIVVKVWNSMYVFLIIKYVFILKMLYFLNFFET